MESKIHDLFDALQDELKIFKDSELSELTEEEIKSSYESWSFIDTCANSIDTDFNRFKKLILFYMEVLKTEVEFTKCMR